MLRLKPVERNQTQANDEFVRPTAIIPARDAFELHVANSSADPMVELVSDRGKGSGEVMVVVVVLVTTARILRSSATREAKACPEPVVEPVETQSKGFVSGSVPAVGWATTPPIGIGPAFFGMKFSVLLPSDCPINNLKINV